MTHDHSKSGEMVGAIFQYGALADCGAHSAQFFIPFLALAFLFRRPAKAPPNERPSGEKPERAHTQKIKRTKTQTTKQKASTTLQASRAKKRNQQQNRNYDKTFDLPIFYASHIVN